MRRSLVNVCLAVLVVLPAAWADTTFEFHSGFWIICTTFSMNKRWSKGHRRPLLPPGRKLYYYHREVC